MSSWGNSRSGKCWVREMSSWGIVQWGMCLLGKFWLGKNVQLGKCPKVAIKLTNKWCWKPFFSTNIYLRAFANSGLNFNGRVWTGLEILVFFENWLECNISKIETVMTFKFWLKNIFENLYLVRYIVSVKKTQSFENDQVSPVISL